MGESLPKPKTTNPNRHSAVGKFELEKAKHQRQ
jgi:hypothetical protein